MNGLRLRESRSIYSEVIVENDTWEQLVSEGIEARQLKDYSQWKLGEIADRCEVRYGQDSVGLLATEIGVNKRTLLRYRDVFRGWNGLEKNDAMSFTHHLRALGSDDPEYWLNEAYENNWSCEKLSYEMGEKEVERCPTCGHKLNTPIDK